MNTIAQSRTEFGGLLKRLRTQRNLTLRALHALSGVVYSMISCIEAGDRAAGGDAARRMADALNLVGEERQQFLFAAAATRRKDRLVEYARTLAPELVNFVPSVLSRLGINLEAVDSCEVRNNVDGERQQILPQMQAAVSQVEQAVEGKANGDFLVLDTGGKRYVCTLLIVPTT